MVVFITVLLSFWSAVVYFLIRERRNDSQKLEISDADTKQILCNCIFHKKTLKLIITSHKHSTY